MTSESQSLFTDVDDFCCPQYYCSVLLFIAVAKSLLLGVYIVTQSEAVPGLSVTLRQWTGSQTPIQSVSPA